MLTVEHVDLMASAIAHKLGEEFSNLTEHEKDVWRDAARAAYEVIEDDVRMAISDASSDAIREHEERQ